MWQFGQQQMAGGIGDDTEIAVQETQRDLEPQIQR